MTTTRIFRRALIVLFLLVAAIAPASARVVVDSAGRRVEVPDEIRKVFAAGPPAAVFVYVLAPQKMVGWPRAPRPQDLPHLRPEVRNLPELGRLTGRGDTINVERLMAVRPDVVVDFGTIDDTYRSLADRIQSQTGIPYLLIDGRFQATTASLRLFGSLLGVPERGETLAAEAERIFADVDRVLASVPADARPRLYLARGTDGFETGSRGSINTEILERVGGVNVVQGVREAGGIVRVSPERIIGWAPDTIVTIDPVVRRTVLERPEWRPVPAVAKNRVFLLPDTPFGSIDFPPSINRLIGLPLLTHLFYPEQTRTPLREEIRRFHTLFYGVEPAAADLDRLLEGLEN